MQHKRSISALFGVCLGLMAGIPQVQAGPGDNPLIDPYYRSKSLQAKGIYGSDDRIEGYQADAAARHAVAATAAFMADSALQRTGGGYRVTGQYRRPLRDAGLCAAERFADQPAAAFCSGFLIDHDLIATAGHCAKHCEDTSVVFGYRVEPGVGPVLDFPARDVYHCTEVVTRKAERRNGQRYDWAIIRLDRPVRGRKPVAVQGGRQVPGNQPLTVIGHPIGLPVKVASGGRVRHGAKNAPTYVTDLDTYGGNSGSPVFTTSSIRAGDPVAVGILVAGGQDFADKSAACRRSVQCSKVKPGAPIGERCSGEEVTNIGWAIEGLPTDRISAEERVGDELDDDDYGAIGRFISP